MPQNTGDREKIIQYIRLKFNCSQDMAIDTLNFIRTYYKPEILGKMPKRRKLITLTDALDKETFRREGFNDCHDQFTQVIKGVLKGEK